MEGSGFPWRGRLGLKTLSMPQMKLCLEDFAIRRSLLLTSLAIRPPNEFKEFTLITKLCLRSVLKMNGKKLPRQMGYFLIFHTKLLLD